MEVTHIAVYEHACGSDVYLIRFTGEGFPNAQAFAEKMGIHYDPGQQETLEILEMPTHDLIEFDVSTDNFDETYLLPG